MNKSFVKIYLLIMLGLCVTTFSSCKKSESEEIKTAKAYQGVWVNDAQLFDDPYENSPVQLPKGYIKVEVNTNGTFVFYRLVEQGSHYPSTEGVVLEASLKGTINGGVFTISDICNDDDGKWYGSVAAALDEENDGDDDKVEDASGINGFISPIFNGTVVNGKLVIKGIKFTKI